MSQHILDRLLDQFGPAVLETHARLGDETALIERSQIVEVCRFLRDDPELRLDMLMDLTAVDYLTWPSRRTRPRYEVVYHLYSTHTHTRIRLKAPVPEDDPAIDSVCPIWKGGDWFEREAWDLYGIKFIGHHDLRRILMYEEFIGHPLRKDYPKERRQPLARRDQES
jgi:NADH-quinone oxidoreductase subunit C